MALNASILLLLLHLELERLFWLTQLPLLLTLREYLRNVAQEVRQSLYSHADKLSPPFASAMETEYERDYKNIQ